MPTAVLLALLGVAGVGVGWFLNVVIVRVPSKEPLFSPSSRCPTCGAAIAPRDNIPVVSWLALRGRCRSCREPIPVGYPLVEVGSGVLWVIAGLRFGDSIEVLPFAAFFSVLLALSVIDLELQILPDAITLPSVLVSAAVIVVLAFAQRDDPVGAIIGSAVGGVGYAAFLFATLLAFELIARKQGMGFGDVKLALLLGLWLGFIHPILVLMSLIAASVLGLVVGVVYLAVRRRSMPFPFGPWLALGAFAAILASHQILESYGMA